MINIIFNNIIFIGVFDIFKHYISRVSGISFDINGTRSFATVC